MTTDRKYAIRCKSKENGIAHATFVGWYLTINNEHG